MAGTAQDLGVSLRCAPGRASRAVGNETTVANGAESPPRQEIVADGRTRRGGAGGSPLRARIPHAPRRITPRQGTACPRRLVVARTPAERFVPVVPFVRLAP